MDTINLCGNIAEELKKQVWAFDFSSRVSDAGRIVACGDGVLTIEGLPHVKNGELLSVGQDKYALVMNLEEGKVGAILLTDSYELGEGDIVYSTGKIVGVPVGDALLGRVVNPLGLPLDGGKPIVTSKTRSVEAPAPAIFDRANVNEPLQTGIKAIDSMIPIGKGQRELIIGDRQTGKTAIAVDTIINQKGKDVICVYVAIGQKTSSVNSVLQTLKNHDALDYTVVVCSTASESAPLQYIAPYTGTAIAEEFMHNGKDVLIVYDDLSKHAVAYRTISLLLKRPSGREAYPGDVFYIHSRLLERSAKLSEKLGGGLSDRSADHRDSRGRHLRLYPHERHFHYGRTDLSRKRAVPFGRASRRQRRTFRLPCRRRRTMQSDEKGEWKGSSRPRALPRNGAIQSIRRGIGQFDQIHSRKRCAPDGNTQTETSHSRRHEPYGHRAYGHDERFVFGHRSARR